MGADHLQEIREEVALADARLAATIGMVNGRDWHLAVACIGVEQERHVMGVEDASGAMVVGNCMLDVNNEVRVGDARFIAMMDPSVAIGLRELLKFAVSSDIDSPLLVMAYQVALVINRKWTEAQKALGLKGRA